MTSVVFNLAAFPRVSLDILDDAGMGCSNAHPLRSKFDSALTFMPEENPYAEHQYVTKWLTKANTFPVGFLRTLLRICKKEDIPARVENLSAAICDHKNLKTEVPLRDYQKTAMGKLLQKRVGICKVPTGGGKTRIACALFDEVRKSKPDAQCLFVVSDTGFLFQTRDSFSEFLPREEIGLFWEEEKRPSQPIVIASIASLRTQYSKYKSLLKPDILIVDECHLFGASGAYNTLKKIEAPYRIGLSATPEVEHDEVRGSRITGNLGEVAYEISVDELISLGFLELADIVLMPEVLPAEASYGRRGINYFVRENKERNGIIASLASMLVKLGQRVMVTTNTTTQMEDICASFEEGIPFVKVYGDVSGDERREIYSAFDKCQGGILIGTVLGIGVDIPETNVMIVADGGKVKSAGIQRLGRILRKKSSAVALFIDFHDLYWGERKAAFEEDSWKITDLRGNKVASCFKYIAQYVRDRRAGRKSPACETVS